MQLYDIIYTLISLKRERGCEKRERKIKKNEREMKSQKGREINYICLMNRWLNSKF
jgi:hypothetical protein